MVTSASGNRNFPSRGSSRKLRKLLNCVVMTQELTEAKGKIENPQTNNNTRYSISSVVSSFHSKSVRNEMGKCFSFVLLWFRLRLYCYRARMISVNKGKQLKCLLKQISEITFVCHVNQQKPNSV